MKQKIYQIFWSDNLKFNKALLSKNRRYTEKNNSNRRKIKGAMSQF